MSKPPFHINCYWGIQRELANHKLTSQLYAQLAHSDAGSDILGSRKDEEEAVNIRPTNLVELYGVSTKNEVIKNSLTLPYLVSL